MNHLSNVCLKCFNGNNLQVEFFWDTARCENTNTAAFEQFEILIDENNECKIRSRYNNHFLQVDRNTGKCKFSNHEEGNYENFKIQVKKNGKLMIGCVATGKFLGCRKNGLVYCDFQNESVETEWHLFSPERISQPPNDPVCFKCFNGNNLQVEFFWDTARCENTNTAAFEQFEILINENNECKIRSRYNNHFLQVDRNTGKCKFSNHEEGNYENFKIQVKKNGKLMIGCVATGKFLGCRKNGLVYCDFQNESVETEWHLFSPERISTLTSNGIIIGACALTLVPLTATAGALMLPAMGFGTQGITAGSLAAGYQSTVFGGFTQGGSLFAALQSAGMTGTGIVYGGVAGAVTGTGATIKIAEHLQNKNPTHPARRSLDDLQYARLAKRIELEKYRERIRRHELPYGEPEYEKRRDGDVVKPDL
ncbi:hypothetical protein BC833DRAFT_625863 [Globomyces pollinis-pini]|nr:hypothetical protein BC833DRAFT_625863 [Globomyces pollinis-pini]